MSVKLELDVVTPSIKNESGGVGAVVKDLYSSYVDLYPKDNCRLLTIDEGLEKCDVSKIDTRISMHTFERNLMKSIGFSLGLLHEANNCDADLIHTHGMWMAVSLYQNIANRKKNIPFVISPHGMLDPWILNRSRFKKLVAKIFYENYSKKYCARYHALNAAEADSILKYNKNAKVEVIPNGVNIDYSYKPVISAYQEKDVFQLLYLGRIHSKKNVESLILSLLAVTKSEYEKKPFLLNIVGWGHSSDIQRINELIEQAPERFCFHGPKFGREKNELYIKSDALVLPSFSEGLPMVVLEAWSFGLPVLMSKHCNLSYAFKDNCAFEVSTDTYKLRSDISRFMKLTSLERYSLALNAFNNVRSKYQWSVIAEDMKQLYLDVLND